VGAVGTYGGTSPNSWSKFKPKVHTSPNPHKQWNELCWPAEYPLSHYELGYLLPHLLKAGRGKLDVYFSRVFNPVWTHPDGFTWMEVLSNEELVGLHVALTPTWNETAYFADYVLPMGHSAERHDLTSYATHTGTWVSFRQPVQREALRRMGNEVHFTHEANIGSVWEEDEFWIDLSWNIDPGNSLGIRGHFESPSSPGKKLSIDVVDEAKKHDMDALEFMRRVGSIEVEKDTLAKHMKEIPANVNVLVDEETRSISMGEEVIGIQTLQGEKVVGFPTPSRRQEIYSITMKEWGWPEFATPGYIKSHIHWENMEENEICLVPTFRLPALIHSRSGNAKWLAEISHTNPVWMNPKTADKYGFSLGDLIRVETDIGYFVNRVWITEGIHPDIIACSHHIGRWRRDQDPINNIWAINTVEIATKNQTKWQIKHKTGVESKESADPDTSRIWWRDGGVHQNITFPVHPDPISGMHCWHQKVKISPAQPGDRYGDIQVDTSKSLEIFNEWLTLTRPGPGPNRLRRPMWLKRPFTPDKSMFYKDGPQ
jgi:anaerobic selenocysteine-containing dehydrogenase